jgi:hypothetical protein
LEDAERLHGKRVAKAASYDQSTAYKSNSGKSSRHQQGRHTDSQVKSSYSKRKYESLASSNSSVDEYEDPWAKWRDKTE